MNQPEKMLTVSEVAVFLRVHKWTVYEQINSGRLAAVRVGHEWRILPSELARFQGVQKARPLRLDDPALLGALGIAPDGPRAIDLPDEGPK